MNRRSFLLALAALPFAASAAIALRADRTEAEQLAGVWPSNWAYPPGDVRRYGAIGDKTTDDTGAFRRALRANRRIVAPGNFRLAGQLRLRPRQELGT